MTLEAEPRTVSLSNRKVKIAEADAKTSSESETPPETPPRCPAMKRFDYEDLSLVLFQLTCPSIAKLCLCRVLNPSEQNL